MGNSKFPFSLFIPVELFETFDDPVIIYERSVTIGVLSVYTWAIFQFALVTTATLKDKNSGDDDIEQNGNALNPSKVFQNILKFVFISIRGVYKAQFNIYDGAIFRK